MVYTQLISATIPFCKQLGLILSSLSKAQEGGGGYILLLHQKGLQMVVVFSYKFLQPNVNFCKKKKKKILLKLWLRITVNLWINLGRKITLAILSLSFHGPGLSLHLFLFSSAKFKKILVYKSYISLVKFIPKYFFLVMLFWIGLY